MEYSKISSDEIYESLQDKKLSLENLELEIKNLNKNLFETELWETVQKHKEMYVVVPYYTEPFRWKNCLIRTVKITINGYKLTTCNGVDFFKSSEDINVIYPSWSKTAERVAVKLKAYLKNEKNFHLHSLAMENESNEDPNNLVEVDARLYVNVHHIKLINT